MRSTTCVPAAAQPHQFEIRIAVLGYVSAGKTTVINALLRDQYGQVGMKRTTAGVNYFRLHHHHKDPSNNLEKIDASEVNMQLQGEESKVSQGDSETEEDWSMCSSEGGFVPAVETLRVISDDNKTLRDGTLVGVKTFDVVTTEKLCEVRPDTRLVLVDIPGINEAGAYGKYRAYVQKQWDTFDCVLVVMDGRHGANTEEHVKLLQLVRDNNKETKDVPVIIVCNKVDDPDDLEQAELVKEVKEEVDRIFRSQADTNRPIFVPTSAEFAYIYRTAALMSFEEFQGFDKDLIDRLGRKEVGWKFSKLSSDEKFRMAYEFVSDMDQYDERIQVTNFNAVIMAIEEAVGGSDTQIQLIQKQIDVALLGLSPYSGYVEKIRGVFHKRKALGQPTDDLPSHFWDTHRMSEDAAFRKLDTSPANLNALAKPIEELIDFCEFVRTHGIDEEQAKCLSRFKSIVVRQIGVILSKSAGANPDWMILAAARKTNVKWKSLVPVDWLRVCQSLLLLSHNSVFCESFGREAMLLDDAKHKWMTAAASSDPTCFGDCPKCIQSPLDFNSFCRKCQNFVSPAECAPLKELVIISGCRKCHRETCSGYNCHHSTTTAAPVSTVGLVVSSRARHLYVDLHCHEGCSGKLSANRFCDKCSAIYCLKGSSRSRQCFLCGSHLKEGRCASQSCGARKLTWKELPYASMLELFSEEYDEKGGVYTAKYLKGDELVPCVEVPADPSDPSHFGHVAWKYCRFMESQVSTN